MYCLRMPCGNFWGRIFSHPLSLIVLNTISPKRETHMEGEAHAMKPHPFCYVLGGGALSLGLSIGRDPTTFRQPGYLSN
jgi:hypothetical protein